MSLGLVCLACLAVAVSGRAQADIVVPEQAAPEELVEEDWSGVAAARHGNVIAVWSSQQILVSRDGGRHFRERLAGAGRVDEVAVSAKGTVFATRGRRLGVLNGAAESWKKLPFHGLIVAGAGRLVLVGRRSYHDDERHLARVAVTADEGATWTFQRTPNYYDENSTWDAHVTDDGRIVLVLRGRNCHEDLAFLCGRVDGTHWRYCEPEDLPRSGRRPRDGQGRRWEIDDAGNLVRCDSEDIHCEEVPVRRPAPRLGRR